MSDFLDSYSNDVWDDVWDDVSRRHQRAQHRLDMRHLADAFGLLGAHLAQQSASDMREAILWLLDAYRDIAKGFTTPDQQAALQNARRVVGQ